MSRDYISDDRGFAKVLDRIIFAHRSEIPVEVDLEFKRPKGFKESISGIHLDNQ